MRVYLPEVLGTLTGCKHFAELVKIDQIHGESSRKLAQKYQIAADWKYIAGLAEQAVDFKMAATTLWKMHNSHQQFLECQQELEDMENNARSPYMVKLKRIKVFANELLKL